MLLPHLKSILELIIKLINDVNFKISITSLNILGVIVKLMDTQDAQLYKDMLIKNLIEKLGDSKIAIRQLTFQILSLFTYVKIHLISLFKNIILSENTCSKFH